MADEEPAEQSPAARKSRAPWLIALVLIAAVVGAPFACSSSGGGGCAAEARSRWSGDNRFVEVTFTRGDFVKGVVKEINGGVESVVRHWECEDGQITFSSLAG